MGQKKKRQHRSWGQTASQPMPLMTARSLLGNDACDQEGDVCIGGIRKRSLPPPSPPSPRKGSLRGCLTPQDADGCKDREHHDELVDGEAAADVGSHKQGSREAPGHLRRTRMKEFGVTVIIRVGWSGGGGKEDWRPRDRSKEAAII